MTLLLKDVSYTYADGQKVISKLNLEIMEGEFISLIGKSGTGKSTILKLITGLLKPDKGEILINGKEVALGDVGYMAQRDLLLPWRTIIDNILLASEINSDVTISKAEARDWLDRVGLSAYETALPQQLSGGMRQRVAFLRTLLMGKDLLLLDEPFGALDALTKKDMQAWLVSIWQELNKTVLFITHDLEEACFLSDRILLLHPNHAVEEIQIDLDRPRQPEMRHNLELVTLRKNMEKKIAHEAN